MSESVAVLPLSVFTEWLASGERGLSSEAMVQRMTGQRIGRRGSRGDHPWDLDDFRRCELLLRQVPIARILLPTMERQGPVWARLVEHWDEIVELAEREVPSMFTPGHRGGRAPLAGARMKAVLAGGAA